MAFLRALAQEATRNLLGHLVDAHGFHAYLSRGCVLPRAGSNAGDLLMALPPNLVHLLAEDGELVRRVDVAHT